MQLPIGAMEFRDARAYPDVETYVDKSAFIGRVLRSTARVLVFCRPRRFGKTLNITMLRDWLAGPIPSKTDVSEPFYGLAVQRDAAMTAERGQKSVLYLSLKGCKSLSWHDNLVALNAEVAEAWSRLGIPTRKVPAHLRQRIADLSVAKVEPGQAALSLRYMANAAAEVTGRPVWVLIDEYDAPIQTAWLHGHYPEAVAFFRTFLGSALKDSRAVHRAVLTGILRVAKEGLFSDLNNVVIDTVLDRAFATDFGFTEDEVRALAGDDPPFLDGLRHWYNGYAIGGQALYNPWSIANALRERGNGFKAHWMASGGTEVIERIATRFPTDAAIAMEQLLSGESVRVEVIEGVVLPEIQNDPSMLANLLLHTGYVTAVAVESGNDRETAVLRVPNLEVHRSAAGLYRRLLAAALNVPDGSDKLIAALLRGDQAIVQDALQRLVLHLVSYHDLADPTPERIYHMFVLGILTRLPPGYKVSSNREFGEGRPDIVIEAPSEGQPSALLEFKRDDSPQVACAVAVQQIRDKRYVQGVRGQPVWAWAVGFAGKGKAVVVELVGLG
ncbi:MAG: AAA family ATPase [Deltaproteobacteria bacterium]|nr:AAA family ATPase [Deltaproteobacteria bacterium]